MTAEFRAMFLWEMHEMVGYAQDNNGHADLQKARIMRDKKDVQEMTDLLFSSWLNPFSDESQPLASISTSAVPSPDNALDLAKAYLSGKAAYQDFKNNRLEPEKLLVKFHDTLKKQKLETFSSMSKAKTIKKNKGEETVIHADRNLYARMVIIKVVNCTCKRYYSIPLAHYHLPWQRAKICRAKLTRRGLAWS